jgi:hypothetical protein
VTTPWHGASLKVYKFEVETNPKIYQLRVYLDNHFFKFRPTCFENTVPNFIFFIEIELYREGLNFVEERLVPASPGHSKKVSARMHQDVTGCARKT